jgi:murein DD-endopeptidase MepM/ murein hydrolase activator NlpD
LNYDFHPPKQTLLNRRKAVLRPRFWLLLGLLVLLIIPLFLRPTLTTTEANTAITERSEPPPVPEIHRELIKGQIAPGDTLTALLGEYFNPQQIHQLNQVSKPIFPLSRLCSGQSYRLCLEDDHFKRFEYDIDHEEQLVITYVDSGFNVEKIPIEYTTTIEPIRGTIETSLFEAVTSIGEAETLAMNLADIFAWDIDFILDIRKGDSFQVLVEKRFREGKPAGYGRILGAEFTNQGTTFEAILFEDGDRRPDYFDANGESLRKAFLKAPLAFTRISSGFTMKRYHPITKTWKAHPAIDYAAPRGTPIKSVGDGTIIRKGYTRGNGNYIKIRHNSTYETIYLHMSKFARGIRNGGRVAQGQVIGYVGSTGLATGPHLCFRMYKNGSPVNPHRVKAPSAAPVNKANLETFKQHAATVMAQLTDHSPVRLVDKSAKPPSATRN